MSAKINVLSQDTIDKIAAGEVIERPSSIVKELVENAIDAGSNAVTIEIKDGGIELIRITDNGEGIDRDMVRTAFLRHATSKIRTVEDLARIGSLGFRGEALSSISAVCQVELITKTAGSITGIRYRIEGGQEKGFEEIGAPEGSTFLVRNIFYNTPARRKFLKSAATEAGYVSDLVSHLALSHPEISFKFIVSGQTRLHTSGNNNLRDIIYSIYGRDTAANLMEVHSVRDGIQIDGFIGKPSISRGNRNFENYYVNNRFVKSTVIARAIEEGYSHFLMQHRYPFTVLKISLDGSLVDINVHPTKMDIRFADPAGVYSLLQETVQSALSHREMIPQVTPLNEKEERSQKREQEKAKLKENAAAPEPFEKLRRELLQAGTGSDYSRQYPDRVGQRKCLEEYEKSASAGPDGPTLTNFKALRKETSKNQQEAKLDRLFAMPETGAAAVFAQGEKQTAEEQRGPAEAVSDRTVPAAQPAGASQLSAPVVKPVQMELFDDRLLSKQNIKKHKLIGQIFDTYWIVEFNDSMYIIDQHAAHEKVMYERLCRNLKNKQQTMQLVSPPVIITLSLQEENLLKKYKPYFDEAGFQISVFGGRDYAITGVPDNLYGIRDADLFTEMLDSLSDWKGVPSSDIVNSKLATMACKSAVKGGHAMSASEADALIGELLELENPYNCPHGRPTIIRMTRYELEKKFKRIV